MKLTKSKGNFGNFAVPEDWLRCVVLKYPGPWYPMFYWRPRFCRHGHLCVFVWNKLPQDIRSATSLPVFRCRL